MTPIPRVLIIAGSDSGGGAGIQADIKTVTMLGGHAMTAITAITAQNTLGVQAVHVVPTDIVLAQINSVVTDIGVDAIKIGMIGSAETAAAVAAYLHSSFPRKRESNSRDRVRRNGQELDPRLRGDDGEGEVDIVFDPVMVATSGSSLADPATIAAFERLMDVATLVTPNIPELAALGGKSAILAHGCALLIKGGHGTGDRVIDRLIDPNIEPHGAVIVWNDERIDTPHSHGTGCTLASAIATGLATGMTLRNAIEQARLFVRLALRSAPGLGSGYGPMGHALVRLDAGPEMRLNQITVPCRDYAATVDFYRALGLTQIVDAPPRYARFEAPGGATFSLNAVEESEAGAVVYFECGNLAARLADLRAAGFASVGDAVNEPWGWWEARLTDPSGNQICLYHAGEMRRFPPWRIDA